MKTAGAFMLGFGIVIFIRIIQFGMNIAWAFPIPVVGVALLALGICEKRQ